MSLHTLNRSGITMVKNKPNILQNRFKPYQNMLPLKMKKAQSK